MGRDDWYRRSNWTDVDREEFFKRLNRSRSDSNKHQYTAIQGRYLLEAGIVEPAIELILMAVTEWPDPIFMASSHLALAHCYSAIQNREKAIQHFRESLAWEGRIPQVQTDAPLDFTWFVLENQIDELYEEAEKALNTRSDEHYSTFPIGQYQASGARAILSWIRGDHKDAQRYARDAINAAAMTESRFRYHRDLGLVGEQSGPLHERLIELAGRSAGSAED